METDFFYSLDKLVEFGLGTAVASQMAQSMNESLSSMTTPGAGDPAPIACAATYFVATNGVATGPYSSTEIARMIAEGAITKETYIWKPGMPNWDLTENLPEVLRLVAMTPPPLPEIQH